MAEPAARTLLENVEHWQAFLHESVSLWYVIYTVRLFQMSSEVVPPNVT